MDDVSYNTFALEGYMLNLSHTIWMFDEVYVFLEQVHFDGHSLITSGHIVTKLAREPNDIYVLGRLEC